MRGTWRPRLLDFARAVPDEVIKDASRQAFSAAENAAHTSEDEYRQCCESAMEPLIKIKVSMAVAKLHPVCMLVCDQDVR
jgi:hypothetical protein